MSERVRKTLLNARVNVICYGAGLLTAFFTRRVFIDCLGLDFMGLTGTLGSLLGFLNLAELGIGTAIGYVLYRPLFDRDRHSIRELISVLGYLYRIIGYVILGAGLVLSCFLPLIFKGAPFSLGVVYFGFYAYLASSLTGYFANYRANLLTADQRGYAVSGIYQICATCKALVQMTLALTVPSLYLFLAVETVFAGVSAWAVNRHVRKVYPWLSTELRQGRGLLKKYPAVTTRLRQVCFHKVGSFVQFQASPLLIYAFVSLPVVGLYTNYTLISSRLLNGIYGALSGATASVGNLVAEGDTDHIVSVYRQMMALNTLVGGVVAVTFMVFSKPLVMLWLGAKYVLSPTVVAVISAMLFLGIWRCTIDTFINAYGLFGDIWAPVAECVLSIGLAIWWGSLHGLTGVILGPLVSMVLIIGVWKPIYLFMRGLKGLFTVHLRAVAQCAFALLLGIVITLIASRFIGYNTFTWWSLIWSGTLFAVILTVTTASLMYLFNSPFRLLIKRIIG